MIDALGRPQSMLVLGGTSDIALATVEALAADRLSRVVLAGRPGPRLDAAAERARAAGVRDVSVVSFDATDLEGHARAIEEAAAGGDLDVVLLAFGVLGDQAAGEADPSVAVETVTVDYVGPVSVGLHAARLLRRQGHGVLVVLSSVAGVRGRRSNFIYGSAKAGLDAFAEGLDGALQPAGARVLTVRPGFVRTKMTAGLPPAPFATSPEQVAAAIRSGLADRKAVVWTPPALRLVMGVARALPRPLFRRLRD